MIISNIATYPGRSTTLPAVIEALYQQVDILNLILNEYAAVPEWVQQYPNVRAVIPAQDLKDTGKFLPAWQDDDMVFLADDDISYPPDYVESSLRKWERLGTNRAIAGYHASIYSRPTSSFLEQKGITFDHYCEHVSDYRDVLHFVFSVEEPCPVDQLGSGTLLAPGFLLPSFQYMQDAQRFVDVRLARWTFAQGIRQIALQRAESWIKPLETSESIYESFTAKNPPSVSQEILSFILTENNQ